MVLQPNQLDDELLAHAATGDRSAIGRLLERHRGRLRNSLAGRIDRRISARLDASDLIQETFAVASRRLPEFLQERRIGFFDWLRGLAMDRLISSRRFHLAQASGRPLKSYRKPIENVIQSPAAPFAPAQVRAAWRFTTKTPRGSARSSIGCRRPTAKSLTSGTSRG